MDESIEQLEKRMASSSSPRQRAEATAALAWKVKYSDPQRAVDLGEEGCRQAEEHGYDELIPRCLLPKAMGHLHLGRAAEAEECALEALDLYRVANNSTGERAACNVLGSIYLQSNDLSRALDSYLSAREIHLSLANEENPGILSNIGAVQLKLGDCESALESFLQARELTDDQGPDDLQAATHSNLGDAYSALGMHAEALECYRDCLAVCRRSGMKKALAITLDHIAGACLKLGRHGQARVCNLEAMGIYSHLNDIQGRASCLANLGKSSCATGDCKTAVGFFRQSLELFEEAENTDGMVSAYLGIAEAQEGMGESKQELMTLKRALELVADTPGTMLRAEVHRALAYAFQRRGASDTALEHLWEYQRLYEMMATDAATRKLSSLRMAHQVERARREKELSRLRQSEAQNDKGRVRRLGDRVRDRVERGLASDGRLAALAEFAGGVAHDFNNVLTRVVAHAELGLASADREGPLATRLHGILDAAAEGAEITGQLLAFSRRRPLRRNRVDLSQLVKDSVSQLLPGLCPGARVSINDRDSAPIVFGDPSELRRMVEALLTSACRGDPAGRRVEIDLHGIDSQGVSVPEGLELLPDRLAVMEVFDDGPKTGAFRECPASLVLGGSEGRRFGLELAEIHGIAVQHGGWMELSAESESGNIVSVFLPEAGDRQAEQPLSSQPPAAGDREDESTILVVEDNEDVLQLVCDILRQAGYRVLACGTLQGALQALKSEEKAVDLVFTDVLLPDGSGIDLARHLAETSPRLRVVLGSGYTPSDDARSFVEERAIPFLVKPYRIDVITQVMRRTLQAGTKA